MEFSTDSVAIFRSHRARDHFTGVDEIKFQPNASGFNANNAWLLAELSRWIYSGKGDGSSNRELQQKLLARAGIVELAFFSATGTHCSLVSSSDGSFAVLVFRGTSQARNWITNLAVGPLRNNAHAGYERALDIVWKDIQQELSKLDCPVYFTGHSMGGALATLAARRHKPTAVYSFGAPPIGNQELVYELGHVSIYRVVNFKDVAVRAPTSITFKHVGMLHYCSWDHTMWLMPEHEQMALDRRKGPRSVTRKLNQAKRIAWPEGLSDHAPQNYVANMYRLCSTPPSLGH